MDFETGKVMLCAVAGSGAKFLSFLDSAIPRVIGCLTIVYLILKILKVNKRKTKDDDELE